MPCGKIAYAIQLYFVCHLIEEVHIACRIKRNGATMNMCTRISVQDYNVHLKANCIHQTQSYIHVYCAWFIKISLDKAE